MKLPYYSSDSSINSASASHSTIDNTIHDAATPRACGTDRELDDLVAANGTRSILYLIAHDNHSEKIARKFIHCQEPWIKVIRINSTVFFESIMYRDVLPQLQHEWENYDYVITGTYKTVTQKGQSLHAIKNLLLAAKNKEHKYDILPFLRSGSGTMSFCLYWHKKIFKVTWDALLSEMGYNYNTIRKHDEMKAFYRNVYVIKPTVLKELTSFMNKAITLGTNNTKIVRLLSSDSNYNEGSKEVSMRIFGTPYYQLYPFVFERLPSFFLHAHNYNICHYKEDGPCKYNT